MENSYEGDRVVRTGSFNGEVMLRRGPTERRLARGTTMTGSMRRSPKPNPGLVRCGTTVSFVSESTVSPQATGSPKSEEGSLNSISDEDLITHSVCSGCREAEAKKEELEEAIRSQNAQMVKQRCEIQALRDRLAAKSSHKSSWFKTSKSGGDGEHTSKKDLAEELELYRMINEQLTKEVARYADIAEKSKQ